MSKPEFLYVTYIETTPEKLWEALTDGAFTERYWFGVHLRSDWNIGSAFEMVRTDGSVSDAGKVVEYDPPRRLAYTFVNLSDTYKGEPAGAGDIRDRALWQTGQADRDAGGLCRRRQVPGWRYPGMAGDPVRPEEPAGNRKAARCPL